MGRPRALGPGGQPGDLWGCHPLPKPLHGSLLPTGPGSSPLWPHLPPLLWPLGSSHATLVPPPAFPRPRPSRSTERPLLPAEMGRLSRSPSFARCCLWEPSDSPLSPLRLLGGESCPSCSSRAAWVSDLL